MFQSFMAVCRATATFDEDYADYTTGIHMGLFLTAAGLYLLGVHLLLCCYCWRDNCDRGPLRRMRCEQESAACRSTGEGVDIGAVLVRTKAATVADAGPPTAVASGTSHRRELLDSFTCGHLRKELRRLGLQVTGAKNELVDRLVGHGYACTEPQAKLILDLQRRYGRMIDIRQATGVRDASWWIGSVLR